MIFHRRRETERSVHRLQLNFSAADAIKPSPGLGSFHEHDNASLRVHDFSCTWLVQCKAAGHVLEARVQWLRTELHFDTVELFKSGMAATSSSLPTEFTLFAAAFDGPPRADIPLVHPWGLKPTVNTGTELRIEPTGATLKISGSCCLYLFADPGIPVVFWV